MDTGRSDGSHQSTELPSILIQQCSSRVEMHLCPGQNISNDDILTLVRHKANPADIPSPPKSANRDGDIFEVRWDRHRLLPNTLARGEIRIVEDGLPRHHGRGRGRKGRSKFSSYRPPRTRLFFGKTIFRSMRRVQICEGFFEEDVDQLQVAVPDSLSILHLFRGDGRGGSAHVQRLPIPRPMARSIAVD
jgi:hypothetical protein